MEPVLEPARFLGVAALALVLLAACYERADLAEKCPQLVAVCDEACATHRAWGYYSAWSCSDPSGACLCQDGSEIKPPAPTPEARP